ncbi:cellulose synthase operon protein YhjQ [Xylophilus rhododendri]|uniref:Cellulose synthase operon protein YhjQ n=1 Tax=Xylophilus rhododendri TaxID=2697032 RepID=A0A857J837_9BURK|nr:cellulose biosynthesis protein BcsQ [Xylophilus rhododendri]QHI98928.1 cellulose synthase operon protein YhjQ [Xylophilus rhododendri]
MKVLAIASAKGGVGKTTVAANLASAMSHAGQPVLVADLDPQNALRLHFGLDPEGIDGMSRATLAGAPWRASCERSDRGVAVMSYGVLNEDDRALFEEHLAAHPDWLQAHLASLGMVRHAIVLLDTPPGPSVYLRQALAAADMALLVNLPDAASYASLPMMEGLIDSYTTHNPRFGGHMHLINQGDATRRLSADVAQVMRGQFGDRYVGLVHRDQVVAEALAYDQSVFDYAIDSQAAADLTEIARTVLTRLAAGAPAP